MIWAPILLSSAFARVTFTDVLAWSASQRSTLSWPIESIDDPFLQALLLLGGPPEVIDGFRARELILSEASTNGNMTSLLAALVSMGDRFVLNSIQAISDSNDLYLVQQSLHRGRPPPRLTSSVDLPLIVTQLAVEKGSVLASLSYSHLIEHGLFDDGIRNEPAYLSTLPRYPKPSTVDECKLALMLAPYSAEASQSGSGKSPAFQRHISALSSLSDSGSCKNSLRVFRDIIFEYDPIFSLVRNLAEKSIKNENWGAAVFLFGLLSDCGLDAAHAKAAESWENIKHVEFLNLNQSVQPGTCLNMNSWSVSESSATEVLRFEVVDGNCILLGHSSFSLSVDGSDCCFDFSDKRNFSAALSGIGALENPRHTVRGKLSCEAIGSQGCRVLLVQGRRGWVLRLSRHLGIFKNLEIPNTTTQAISSLIGCEVASESFYSDLKRKNSHNHKCDGLLPCWSVETGSCLGRISGTSGFFECPNGSVDIAWDLEFSYLKPPYPYFPKSNCALFYHMRAAVFSNDTNSMISIAENSAIFWAERASLHGDPRGDFLLAKRFPDDAVNIYHRLLLESDNWTVFLAARLELAIIWFNSVFYCYYY